MGFVEAGVREDLQRLGIKEPKTMLEHLAIELARSIDNGVDEKNLAAISGRLVIVMGKIAEQPKPVNDAVGNLIDKQ